MSRFAILKLGRIGSFADLGTITVNIDQIVAMEEEPYSSSPHHEHTRLTLSGGREVCVRGEYAAVRRKLLQIGRRPAPVHSQSLFDLVFGRDEKLDIFGRRS